MRNIILVIFFNGLISMMPVAQDTDWLQKGLEAEEPKEQIAFFTKSIEQGNELSASYFSRASAKSSAGDVQGAIDDYTKCIEIDSGDIAAYYSRGMAKQTIAINYQEAVADLAKAFENSSPGSGYAFWFPGVECKNEDCQGVIVYYDRILRHFPDDPSFCSKLGYCYLALGNDSLALENFNKTITLRPEKPDACLGLALVYYYRNDLVNAKKHFDQARSLNPALQHGPEGFETYKKEGFIYSDRDNEALKRMFTTWK